MAVKKTVMVFPVDVPSALAAGGDQVSGLLTDIAASKLAISKAYSVTVFHKAAPTVVRLKNDGQLGDADVTAPFSEDNRKALKVGRLAGYDVVCVASVDDYSYADADKMATVTLSARLIEVETGKVTKTVSLAASSGKGGNAKEEDRAIDAARTTGEQAFAKLVPTVAVVSAPTDNTPKVTERKKRRGNDWIWGLLAVGLGVGLGLSGGGGGGGGIDNPPPPP
ncbi:MAG: hypothetical protein NT029_00235 [Armatimonadetes bacterium]|nr:hypothetical protein [Armatimonadota bacterium]